MLRHPSPLCSLSLGLFVMLGLAGPAAGADDMARYLPAEAAFYVGWSQWVAPDSPELRSAQKLLRGVAGAEQKETRLIAPLLELIGPLQTGSVGIGLLDVSTGEAGLDVQLAAVADVGPDANDLAEALRKLLAARADAVDIQAQTVRGVELQACRLSEQFTLLWGVHRERFIVALGQTAAGKLIDCLNGQLPPLAESAELQFNRRKVGARLDGRYFCIYADVQRMLSRGKELAAGLLGELPPVVDQALSELGLTSVRSKYLHVECGEPPRMTAFAHIDGPRRGLLALWEQKPLTDEDLKLVPKDAYWMQVANLDLSAVWTETKRVLGELAPEALPMIEGGLAMTAGLLGFSITDNLLPAFGDTWALFDARDHGGLLLTGTVLVAEVKDVAALRGMIERATSIVAGLLMQTESVALLRRQTQHQGHTVEYVIIGGVPCPVAPAWGFVGDRLVFGLYPQTVATAMKQVDPQTRGPSILDHPAFQSARRQLPEQVMSIGYYDSQYFVRLLYPFMKGLGAAGVSMLAEHGMDMDLELLPPLPELVGKTTNYVGTCSTDPDGILYASIGDGTPLAAAAGGAAMAGSILLPSLVRSRELAKRAVSSSNLRGIGMACHMYAYDHDGQFPASLAALLEADLITSEMLQSPLQPDRPDAYVYIDGQRAEGDPRNVLAYERPVGAEGANVLFVDGHVEFLDLESLKQALRATYERQERAGDLPAELRR